MNNSFLATIALLFLCAGCKTVKVISFENPSVNFARFEEYSIEIPALAAGREFSEEGRGFIQKFETAISREMDGRGYKLTYSPQLKITFSITSTHKKEVTPSGNQFLQNTWFYDAYYSTYDNNYTESTIIIELKEANTGKLAWQGSLDMRQARNSKRKEHIISDAVQQIFSEYPHLAGSSKIKSTTH